MNSRLLSPHRFFSSLALLLILLGTAACGASPAATEGPSESPTQVEEIPSPVEEQPVETSEPASVATSTPEVLIPVTGAAPALPEYRKLTLEFPSRIKAGAESDLMRLALEVDDLDNIVQTVEVDGTVIQEELIAIPNVYETHNVNVEARFDISGLDVTPSGPTFQPMKQGAPVVFYWSVQAQNVGTYRGTIWLYLNFEDRQTGVISPSEPVSSQIVEIEAVDFFGFSTNFVRTSGVVGSVLGTIVGFPFFKDIVKYLYEKSKKPKRKPGKSARKT